MSYDLKLSALQIAQLYSFADEAGAIVYLQRHPDGSITASQGDDYEKIPTKGEA